MPFVLGVDVGGVLLRRTDYQEDATPSGPQLTASSAVPGALVALRRLATLMFGTSIFLVSKCGPKTEERTREWLASSDFARVTGVPTDNVRFCRKRRDKAEICDELAVTHFVDVRLEVLSYLTAVQHRFLFDPDPDEVAEFAGHLPSVRVVDDWASLTEALLHTRPR